MSKRDQEKFDRKRGRHKKNSSPESQDWNNQNLNIPRPAKPKPVRLPPPPEPPTWMDLSTARKLYALRRRVAQ